VPPINASRAAVSLPSRSAENGGRGADHESASKRPSLYYIGVTQLSALCQPPRHGRYRDEDFDSANRMVDITETLWALDEFNIIWTAQHHGENKQARFRQEADSAAATRREPLPWQNPQASCRKTRTLLRASRRSSIILQPPARPGSRFPGAGPSKRHPAADRLSEAEPPAGRARHRQHGRGFGSTADCEPAAARRTVAT